MTPVRFAIAFLIAALALANTGLGAPPWLCARLGDDPSGAPDQVALWPMLFAFAEQLVLTLPWTARIGSLDGATDLLAMTTTFSRARSRLQYSASRSSSCRCPSR
jgi:hypothetical protein